MANAAGAASLLSVSPHSERKPQSDFNTGGVSIVSLDFQKFTWCCFVPSHHFRCFFFRTYIRKHLEAGRRPTLSLCPRAVMMGQLCWMSSQWQDGYQRDPLYCCCPSFLYRCLRRGMYTQFFALLTHEFIVEVCTGSKLKPEPGPYPRLSDPTRPDPSGTVKFRARTRPEIPPPPQRIAKKKKKEKGCISRLHAKK